MIEVCEPYFIDTNLLVYAFDVTEGKKHKLAKKKLNKIIDFHSSAAISTQTLTEFFVVITNKVKQPLTEKQAYVAIKNLIKFDNILKLKIKNSTILKAIELKQESKAKYWDALIAATMIENQIFTIYTEDVKHFSKFSQIKAINPLK